MENGDKLREVLKEELEKVKISADERKELEKVSMAVIAEVERKVKKKKINASVFVGGSLAKNTLLRKKNQDIDLFLRFDKSYSEEDINKAMRKVFFFFRVPGYKIKLKKLHGSRDYVRIDFKGGGKEISSLSVEVVPTLKISKPEEARNVTDLSYFHVNYLKESIKKQKGLADEIILAKAFCHAQNVYGAESYINGLSGYALELLVVHYKSFINFLEETSKMQANERVVIDTERQYKSQQEALDSLNLAKKQSPIILIDPTFKDRNATASLSSETLEKLKRGARAFLKNPSIEMFEEKKIELEWLKTQALKAEGKVLVLEIKTNKQAGDIAGTKLLKFSKVISREIAKNFDVLGERFDYMDGKKASIYYVIKRKKEIIFKGPLVTNKIAVDGFKKEHPVWHTIGEGNKKRICASKDPRIEPKKMIKEFKKNNKKLLRQMSIVKMKVVKVY